MRVLLASQSATRTGGGIATVLKGFAESLSIRGNVVSVVSQEDDFSREDCGEWRGPTHLLIPPRPLLPLHYSAAIAAAVREVHADVIHIHGLWSAFSTISTTFDGDKHIPRVVSPHGMLEKWALRQGSLKKRLALATFEGSNLRQAQCIHALTEREAEDIRCNGFTNPVCIIPNGVDNVPINTCPPPWAATIAPDSRVLLFLGRVHPKKGLHLFLRQFADLLDNVAAVGTNWYLVVAGPDSGETTRDLIELSRALHIQDHVHFVGPVYGETKGAALHNATAFVLPSLSEGLPMAVLEAWAYGKPVLMTDECGLPIGFEHGAAAELLIGAGNSRASLERFLRLSDDELSEMGLKGIELVKQRFLWGNVAEKFELVYQWLRGQTQKPSYVI